MGEDIVFAIICMDTATNAIAYGSNVSREGLAEVLESLRLKILVDVARDQAAPPPQKV